ncbi:ExbD/TolR family protein [Pseudorhodoferax sp.]|uniref:ExbD/TolR family protein n=1 Tax=Pseudorhodoferax sp. TaxID=1993553 RepID=UPI002DD68774|nr:biopolymer transporter ExbD [Pseudorhodoferax sp.]
MAMNVGSGGADEPLMEMNTTPLIDVMLVLLIMLIVTIPIQTHAVRLDLPVYPVPPKPVEPPVVVRVDIGADGTVSWNGEVLPDRAALETRLGSEAPRQPQPEFHIRPDPQVHYKHVAAVMTSAQRLGLHKLGIVGQERFQ